MTQFIKNKEDFVCDHCGAEVQGTGYTNHCPRCLWSKHVDVNPGDRAAVCKGAMKPLAVEFKNNESVLIHECIVCGYKKRNKMSEGDSMDEAARIQRAFAEKNFKK
jgi:hypothetical protein